MSAASQEVIRLENALSDLQNQLLQARNDVQSWVDANASLSRSAAQERAKNQGAGRGLVSSFLGAKFRSAMRAGAAASNASIAKDVAAKRQKIAAGKASAQDRVAQIQALITEAKSQIRQAKAEQRAQGSVAKARGHAKSSVDLLHKLKEAHTLGLLTDAEFEEKRAKLVRNM
ncbi:F0F1-type ATP synthase membrane subunit b/b' [Acidovorax soli]|uniref:F0F1-type ATP synthase membrane subunit b/b n=1 Tax=Acidovorax soli TaxID=592050 RepID=A0A7X0PBQ7_9BURK|nr:hypothetical protein [Acidovorax soli]MBB6558864.1 F0F1-type ATP synthase membrane subunit b/b' [Acidovorax soli]